eukprot:114481-Rhodomonas_salina.1
MLVARVGGGQLGFGIRISDPDLEAGQPGRNSIVSVPDSDLAHSASDHHVSSPPHTSVVSLSVCAPTSIPIPVFSQAVNRSASHTAPVSGKLYRIHREGRKGSRCLAFVQVGAT